MAIRASCRTTASQCSLSRCVQEWGFRLLVVGNEVVTVWSTAHRPSSSHECECSECHDIGGKRWRYLCLQCLLRNLERIELRKNLNENGVVGASGHGLGGEQDEIMMVGGR